MTSLAAQVFDGIYFLMDLPFRAEELSFPTAVMPGERFGSTLSRFAGRVALRCFEQIVTKLSALVSPSV